MGVDRKGAEFIGNNQTSKLRLQTLNLIYISTSVVVKTFLGLKTKTLAIRSRDRDRDLDKMNLSALQTRDHGLKITTRAASIPIGDRALA